MSPHQQDGGRGGPRSFSLVKRWCIQHGQPRVAANISALAGGTACEHIAGLGPGGSFPCSGSLGAHALPRADSAPGQQPAQGFFFFFFLFLGFF